MQRLFFGRGHVVVGYYKTGAKLIALFFNLLKNALSKGLCLGMKHRFASTRSSRSRCAVATGLRFDDFQH